MRAAISFTRGCAAMLLAMMATLIAAPPASATNSPGGQCARFDVLGNGLRLTYQPFEPGAAADTFDLRIDRLSSNVDAVRFVIIDPTRGTQGFKVGPAGPEVYALTWTERPDRTVLTGAGGVPEGLIGAETTLPGRQGRSVMRFLASVPGAQAAAAGRHIQPLTIRYQCLDDRGRPISGLLEQPATLEMIVTVPSSADIYVGSVGQSRGSINFGTIGAGSDLSRTVPVITRATSAFVIDIDTENNERLLRPGNNAGAGAIAYGMRLGTTVIADGDRLACPATAMPSGQTDLLEVTLDSEDVARVPAGRYRDVITLSVTPSDIRSSAAQCQPIR